MIVWYGGCVKTNLEIDCIVSDGTPQERSSDGDSEGWTRRKEHALETQLGPNIVSGDDEIQKSSWTKGMFRLGGMEVDMSCDTKAVRFFSGSSMWKGTSASRSA